MAVWPSTCRIADTACGEHASCNLNAGGRPIDSLVMTLHLIKLSVGTESVDDLEVWIAHRRAQARAAGLGDTYWHTTRMVPRRVAEILDGGSIYWVIKGMVLCRQAVLDVEAFQAEDGVQRCRLVLAPELVRTRPVPKRPFQGWRYLKPGDAPADLSGNADGTLPVELESELSELGLL